MVPCPWFPYAATLWRNCPTADVGLHLTLTSEWRTYRWAPDPRDPATGSWTRPYFPTIRRHSGNRSISPPQVPKCRLRSLTPARPAWSPPTWTRTCLPSWTPGCCHGMSPWRLPTAYPPWWSTAGQQLQYDPQQPPSATGRTEQANFDHLAEMPLEACHADRLRQATALFDALPPGLSCLLLHPALDTPGLGAIAPDWPCRVATMSPS